MKENNDIPISDKDKLKLITTVINSSTINEVIDGIVSVTANINSTIDSMPSPKKITPTDNEENDILPPISENSSDIANKTDNNDILSSGIYAPEHLDEVSEDYSAYSLNTDSGAIKAGRGARVLTNPNTPTTPPKENTSPPNPYGDSGIVTMEPGEFNATANNNIYN